MRDQCVLRARRRDEDRADAEGQAGDVVRLMWRLLFLLCVSVAAAQEEVPVIIVETAKGTFELETYPSDAPKTVAHIVALVRQGFYDGQRIHRAQPGFVVQWGDPQSRDPGKERDWGRGQAASSGQPIGVAEMTKKRAHTKGAVAVAHPGSAAKADSQIYVTLADRTDLNGKYTVFGHVISGQEVPDRLQTGDVIRKMSVRE